MLIRVFGGLPEGVMYAILLMNAATPLIDRYTQPRVFGRQKESS
jgi:electron transport complex protein RnfD